MTFQPLLWLHCSVPGRGLLEDIIGTQSAQPPFTKAMSEVARTPTAGLGKSFINASTAAMCSLCGGFRVTSSARKYLILGPYSRAMPMVLQRS